MKPAILLAIFLAILPLVAAEEADPDFESDPFADEAASDPYAEDAGAGPTESVRREVAGGEAKASAPTASAVVVLAIFALAGLLVSRK